MGRIREFVSIMVLGRHLEMSIVSDFGLWNAFGEAGLGVGGMVLVI